MSNTPPDLPPAPHDLPRPRALDPSPEERRRIAHEVLDLLLDDYDQLAEKPVLDHPGQSTILERLDEQLPTIGSGVEATVERFRDLVLPGMTRVSHPRFHAFIPVPSSFYGFLGQMIASSTNPFTGSWLGGSSITALEVVVLRWLAEAIGYQADATGILTSGGSLANLNAIATAAAHHDIDDRRRATLYFSDQGHTSAQKAATILGFPSDNLRVLKTDRDLHLQPATVAAAVEEDRQRGLQPFFLCANAGTTNTGAIDPLPELAELALEHDLWFHIDAAYGGFAALCPEGRESLRGMERADSLTLDPHKWLYCPMGIGCFLTRHRHSLERAFETHAGYLKQLRRDQVNFFDRGVELSRPGRAIAVWFLLRSAGVEQIAAEVREDLRLARWVDQQLRHSDRFEVVAKTELSAVTFRLRRRPEESEERRQARDLALYNALLDDGRVMLSTTELAGATVLRLVVMSHRTDEAEARRSLAVLNELAAALED